MATLTNAEKFEIFKLIRQNGFGKAELKASGISAPKLGDCFQAMEDFWELPANKAAAKSAIDTAAGFSTTNAFAKKIAKAWLAWKWGGE